MGDHSLHVMVRPGDDERYADGALIEAAPLPVESVIPEHLSMIAGIDDDRVVTLPGFLEHLQQPANILVDEFYHAEVVGLVASL